MKQPIDLEFVGRDRHDKGTRAGWGMFGFGLIAAAAAAVLYSGIAERSEQWEQAARKASRADSATRTGAGVPTDPLMRTRLTAQVADANDVIGRLSLPWNALFLSIESCALDTVALLGVQPQPEQRLVTLVGEARSYADILEYMERLDASVAFVHSRLVSHKVKREAPGHPVDFVIAAQWRMAP
jgi:hypothetical protein